MARIPIAGPWITDLEVQYAADAAANGWYERAGEYLRKFEQAFARRIGVKHAIAVPHCTAAIHLSLVAQGVGEGDQVIVPDVTWIASAAPVRYVGAEPVFADIDEATWCLSPGSLRECITERTKAVIPVDLYGNMPDMAAIRAVADEHGLAVIEDAAEAIGSQYHGRMAGSFGDTGVFSFHGSKTLTTGEGGMLVPDRDDIHERVLFLRDHGRAPGNRHFYNDEVAFKYRMSPVQAAIGLAQTERFDELIARKREIFSWYADELTDVDGVMLNPEPEGTINSYWMVTALINERFGLTSRDLMDHFDALDIDVRPFFHPLSSIPAFRDTDQAAAARQRNTTSYHLSPRGINLPSAMNLDRDGVARVCRGLSQALG